MYRSGTMPGGIDWRVELRFKRIMNPLIIGRKRLDFRSNRSRGSTSGISVGLDLVAIWFDDRPRRAIEQLSTTCALNARSLYVGCLTQFAKPDDGIR